MAVKYDLYKNPPRKDGKTRVKLHARVAASQTVETDQLVNATQAGCTLTDADVKAVLSALKHSIVRFLEDGKQVHVEGLGYFGMTLECRPVESAKEIRAESVKFKNVTFRPEKALKKHLSALDLVRSDRRNHSNEYSEIETDALLTDYFSDHTYILRSEFCNLCGFKRMTGIRRLNELVEKGKLKKEGAYRSPIYVPAEGSYRK